MMVNASAHDVVQFAPGRAQFQDLSGFELTREAMREPQMTGPFIEGKESAQENNRTYTQGVKNNKTKKGIKKEWHRHKRHTTTRTYESRNMH